MAATNMKGSDNSAGGEQLIFTYFDRTFHPRRLDKLFR